MCGDGGRGQGDAPLAGVESAHFNARAAHLGEQADCSGGELCLKQAQGAVRHVCKHCEDDVGCS
jgi:hypothetical protein